MKNKIKRKMTYTSIIYPSIDDGLVCCYSFGSLSRKLRKDRKYSLLLFKDSKDKMYDARCVFVIYLLICLNS